MIRTQVQLTEDQASRIRLLAKKKRVSQAEIIRRFVDKMLPLEEVADIAEIKKRAIAAAGKVRSKTGDLAAKHNEYYVEASEN